MQSEYSNPAFEIARQRLMLTSLSAQRDALREENKSLNATINSLCGESILAEIRANFAEQMMNKYDENFWQSVQNLLSVSMRILRTKEVKNLLHSGQLFEAVEALEPYLESEEDARHGAVGSNGLP